MRNVNIIFTDNGWYLPGGFIAILFFFSILLVVAWKNRRMPSIAWLLPLVGFVFGLWFLDDYAKSAFGSFLRLERQDSVIRFYYYFGQPREFRWQDVQKIVSKPAHKGASQVRFFMRDGTELTSYETADKNTIERALSLASEIR
jgi:hypothetical protein